MSRIGCLGLCCLLLLSLAIPRVATIVVQRRAMNDALVGHVGNPRRGHVLLAAYGCQSCHTAGSGAPEGTVGPPLDDMGARSYIAGRFANEPIEMQEWIEHPRKLKPETAMPDLGVTERDARDIAAYLATLR